MEAYISYKGNNYTLLINLINNRIIVMLGMRDVTHEFSQDELSYIRDNVDDLML